MVDITPVIVTVTPIPTQTIVPDPTLLVQYGNETFTYVLQQPWWTNTLVIVVAMALGFFFGCVVIFRD